jgi:hypothetical protein
LIGLLHSTDERVQEHALDALIRLKAKVPEEELRGLPKSYRDQVILLAIANGYRDVLLSILRQGAPNDAMWVALNEGILSLGASRDYWEALLGDWTICVWVYVTDSPASVNPERHGSVVCGDGPTRVRPGFPPRPLYGFSLTSGGVPLISKPYEVYVSRGENLSGCFSRINRSDYQAAFVRSAVRETYPIGTHPQFEAVWDGDEAYLKHMEEWRAEVAGEVHEIVDRLGTTARPHVQVFIQDQRADKSHPLPPTPR